MLYIVVHWNGKTWVIDHYSHLLEDVLVHYKKGRQAYGKLCRLMVDDRILFLHNDKVNTKFVQEKSAEVRDYVQSTAQRLEEISTLDTESNGSPELEEYEESVS